MGNLLKQSSTGQALVFLMIDSSDHISPKTGLSPTVTIRNEGGSFGSPSGTVSEIGSGWYQVAGNATDTGTLGSLLLHATATGADPVDLLYLVVAFDPLTTGPGGVPVVGTGANNFKSDASANVTSADNIKFGGQTITAANPITVLASVGTAATSTAQTGDAYAIVNNGTYGNAQLSRPGTAQTITAPYTAAQIAMAVWTDATPGDFTVASSIGNSLYTGNHAPGTAAGLALVGSTMVVGNVTVGGYAVHQDPLWLLTGASVHLAVNSSGFVTYANASPPSEVNIAGAVWTDMLAGSDFGTALSVGALIKAYLNAPVGSIPTNPLTSLNVGANAPGAAGGLAIVGSAMTLAADQSVNVTKWGGVAVATAFVQADVENWGGAALPTTFAASNLPSDYQQRNVAVTLPPTPPDGYGGSALEITADQINQLCAAVAPAIWTYADGRTLSGASPAAPADAAAADADIDCTVFAGGTTRLVAHVYIDGRDIQQTDVASIAYSVFLLDAGDEDTRYPVTGQTAVALEVANVIFDSLQTDAQAAGYNFLHIVPIDVAPAFAEPGRTYIVEYAIVPVTGQKLIVRFRARAI